MSCPGAGNARADVQVCLPDLTSSMMLCNLWICMSEEMKLYAQSLDLLWAYISGKVTSPLYDVAWYWRCPRLPVHRTDSCRAGSSSVAEHSSVCSSLSHDNAVMGPLFTAPQTFLLADKAGLPRTAATALFLCCFNAFLILFSWPCACDSMESAHENPPSACLPCLVEDFLVCTRDNQSKVNSTTGDGHLNT